jgi:superfamily II DNA or RNA helicase
MSSTQKNPQKKLLNYTDLSLDQVGAVDFMYENNTSVLMVPVGFGKTVVSLTAIKDLLKDKVFKRVLIVAPLKVCEMTWAGEHRKWRHLVDMDIAIATGTPADREAALTSKAKVVVVNFENVSKVLEHNKTYGFDALLVDELTKLKGGGQALKSIRKAFKQLAWCAGMTGTLVEEGLEFLFYQYLAIDGGATFGRNKQNFLREYFIPDYNEYNWEPKPDAMERLSAKIKPRTYSVDSYDQPPAVVDYKFIDMPEHARELYNSMKKDMLLEFDDEFAEAANAAVMSGKLQQICAGFIYTESSVRSIHAHKMRSVVEEIKVGVPTIVV